jgi:hypothetical protein
MSGNVEAPLLRNACEEIRYARLPETHACPSGKGA